MNSGPKLRDMEYRLRKAVYYPGGVEQRGISGRAYLGISLNNQITRSETALTDMLTWMKKHFRTFDVLIGDHLNRHNVMVSDGLDEHAAGLASHEQAEQVKQRIQAVAFKLGQSSIEYRSSLSFYSTPTFSQRVHRLQCVFNKDTRFRQLVQHTTDVFLRRKHPLQLDSSSARERSIAYQLEELAIFEILAEQGLKVNVYPGGQLPTMMAIVQGKLPAVSAPLEDVTLVELQMIPQNRKP